MRSESKMWAKLRGILRAAALDPVRIENPIHPGTPDVNMTIGWMELKTIAAWPQRGIFVRIAHFTPQQRVFLYRRWRAKHGTTYLLLEVRSTKMFYLFDGDVAAKVVGRSTVDGHRANARAELHESELAQLPKYLRVEPPKPIIMGAAA